MAKRVVLLALVLWMSSGSFAHADPWGGRLDATYVAAFGFIEDVDYSGGTSSCIDPDPFTWPDPAMAFEEVLRDAGFTGAPIFHPYPSALWFDEVRHGSCYQWGYESVSTECPFSSDPEVIGARFIVVDVRTGATIRYVSPAGRSYTCIWVIEISDVQAVVWESIPTPEYRVNPFKGLTQLDTWLWYDTEPYWVAAQRTVPSPTGALLDITVEAWVESIRWDLDGDGEWEHSQSIPQATKPLDPAAYRAFGGAEEDPAFTWVYETKGSYQPVMEVTWTGRWQWTALGGGWRYLDPQNVDSPVSVDYQVWEIRAFLTTED